MMWVFCVLVCWCGWLVVVRARLVRLVVWLICLVRLCVCVLRLMVVVCWLVSRCV